MQPRTFFQKVQEAHASAVERVGSTEFCLDVAGRRMRISFASDVLSDRLISALMHRVCESGSEHESLTILVWDTASTGIQPPPPPWGPYDYLARGEVRGFGADGIRTAFHPGANVLSIFNESTATAIFWTPDGAALPEYQVGSPFLIILNWWAETQKLTIVHSGAVGRADGGVLLAGQGGSGKSTTALACAGSLGMRYVSDDYCLLETSDGDRAHSVFSSGKLDAKSLNLLPRFGPWVSDSDPGDSEKAIIFLSNWIPDELADSLPIKAILLPNTAESDATRIRPASPGEALRALAPSTIFQLTGAGNRAFVQLGSLVRRLPSFHLDLSRDMSDTPAAISSLLEQVA